MIHVEYSAHGDPCSDHHAETVARGMVHNNDTRITTTYWYSTVNVIEWLRVCLREGLLQSDNLVVVVFDSSTAAGHEGVVVRFTQDGRFDGNYDPKDIAPLLWYEDVLTRLTSPS